MGLDVEEVRSENRVSLDLVENNLAAEVLVAEVEALLADRLCLDLPKLQLLPVVRNHLLNLLVQASEVVLAPLEPLLFAVVFEFEDSVGDDFVDEMGIGWGDVLRAPLGVNVEVHGQEEDVLIELHLILHVLDLRKYLKHNKP